MTSAAVVDRSASAARLSARVAQAAAAIAAVIGAIVLFGWHAHVAWLVRLTPAFTPVRYNTALSFVLAGIALAAAVRGARRVALPVAAAGLAIALVTLSQDVTGIDWRIDESIMGAWLRNAGDAHPGRMAVNTATGLIMIFAALLLAGRARRPRALPAVVSGLGSVASGLGTVALIGYASNLPMAYAWRGFAGIAIAPVSAATIALLGAGLVALAWNHSREFEAGLPRWMPVVAAVIVMTCGVVLWQALASRDYQSLSLAVRTASQGVVVAVQSAMQDRVRAIERVAHRARGGERPGTPIWDVDQKVLVRDYPGLRQLDYVFADATESSLTTAGYPGELARAVVDTIGSSDGAPRLGAVIRSNGRRTFVIAVPVDTVASLPAFVIGVFTAADSLRADIEARGTLPYDVRIAEQNGGVAWTSGTADNQPAVDVAVPLFGREWTVRVAPGAQLLEQWDTLMPEVTLGGTALLALLLASVLGLFQTSRRAQEQAEAARATVEREVVERKRIEESLRHSEALLRLVLDTLPVGAWIADATGRIVMVNAAAEQIWGGARYVELTGYGEYKGWRPGTGEQIKGEEWPLARAVRGETVPKEVADIETFDGFRKTITLAAAPVRRPDGTLGGAVVVGEDVTERRRADQLLAERTADLERSNAELEQFAYVASHDLQEPLRMVASYVQLLARRYGGRLDADADDFIRFAVDGSRRMQSLLNDLLTFSRVGTRGKPFARVDMNEALRMAEENLQVAIAESGAIVAHDPLPAVAGDETQIVQVLQNLLANAIKFRSAAPPAIRVSAAMRNGRWAISVADNGIGIDPAYHDRIFQIFQRLHGQRYPGTGVGLAICKKIVARHGGAIAVHSREGAGTMFVFTMPVVGAPDAPSSPNPAGSGRPHQIGPT